MYIKFVQNRTSTKYVNIMMEKKKSCRAKVENEGVDDLITSNKNIQ